jgi:hypothetical protein
MRVGRHPKWAPLAQASTSEGYCNTHKYSADGYHDHTRCPWPNSGMTYKRNPQINNDMTANAVEVRSADLAAEPLSWLAS